MEDKRKQWIDAMCKIVTPVLDMLEHGKLKQSLPLTFHEERKVFAPLEAFGRSMLGLAPWLETDSETLDEEERTRQAVYRAKAVRCIEMATNPESPDFMLFDEGGQPLVDAAFLAHALVRAPKALAAGNKKASGRCASKHQKDSGIQFQLAIFLRNGGGRIVCDW